MPLRRMNEAGVLGRFVPDFGRVVAQMQYDMYHVYTVDEHTLFAIGILHDIEIGDLKDELPLASEVIPRMVSRRALYVAMMLHDIAKGRGGDHPILGAKVAEKLVPALRPVGGGDGDGGLAGALAPEDADAAFKRDMEDRKTIRDLSNGSSRRNAAAAAGSDHRRYPRGRSRCGTPGSRRCCANSITGPTTDVRRPRGRGARRAHRRAQAAVARAAARFREEEIERLRHRGYPVYWLSLDPETHARHARLMREAEATGAPLTVDKRIDRSAAVTEITIYTADHPGLFSRMAGALALCGANIVDAKIMTMSNGMAVERFWMQDPDGEPSTAPTSWRGSRSWSRRC